jgi:hypothetical protein
VQVHQQLQGGPSRIQDRVRGPPAHYLGRQARNRQAEKRLPSRSWQVVTPPRGWALRTWEDSPRALAQGPPLELPRSEAQLGLDLAAGVLRGRVGRTPQGLLSNWDRSRLLPWVAEREGDSRRSDRSSGGRTFRAQVPCFTLERIVGRTVRLLDLDLPTLKRRNRPCVTPASVAGLDPRCDFRDLRTAPRVPVV